MPRGRIHVPLDVDYWYDPKLAGCSEAVELMFVRMLATAKRLLSDGVVTDQQLSLIGLSKPAQRANELVARKILKRTKNGYQFIGWLNWNKSKAQLDELSEVRANQGKKGGTKSGLVRAERSKQGSNLLHMETNTESESESESSSSKSPPPKNEEDEFQIMANRAFAVSTTEKPSPKGWLRKVASDRKEAFGEQALRIRTEHPDWSPTQIADVLEPPAIPEPLHISKRKRPECVTCENRGVVETSVDVYAPCPDCNAEKVSA